MEKKREYIYDFLRVLSCVFIIGIHCASRLFNGYNNDIVMWQYNIINSIVRSGLLLFVFISGALILNTKVEKQSEFYLKRFVKIVIPFLVYSYIYLWIDKYTFSFEMFLPKNIISSLLDILSSPVSYHLWFVYMIIGIYIFVPYLKKMLQNLTNIECRNLFILLYLISFIKYFLPSFNINIGINCLLIIDWLIPFVLGYLLTKENISSHYFIIYIMGILSFVFLIIATRFFPNMKHLYDLAPTMLMQSQAIFVFFIRNKNKICVNGNLNKIASYIANYCYEIYLIHALVLNYLQKLVFTNVCIISPMINTFIAIILTFAVSFIFTFIIHNLIVKTLINLFKHFVDLLKNLCIRLHT